MWLELNEFTHSYDSDSTVTVAIIQPCMHVRMYINATVRVDHRVFPEIPVHGVRMDAQKALTSKASPLP